MGRSRREGVEGKEEVGRRRWGGGGGEKEVGRRRWGEGGGEEEVFLNSVHSHFLFTLIFCFLVKYVY